MNNYKLYPNDIIEEFGVTPKEIEETNDVITYVFETTNGRVAVIHDTAVDQKCVVQTGTRDDLDGSIAAVMMDWVTNPIFLNSLR